MVARRAHNPKVVGSNPAPATTSYSKKLPNNNLNNVTYNDTGVTSIVYVSNTSSVDNILTAQNPANNSDHHQFNCLYPAPKKDLPYGVLSPSFKTMYIQDQDGHDTEEIQQYAVIKNGTTVAYAFNSRCDSEQNSERLAVRNKKDYSLYVSLGEMYQDINVGYLSYIKYVSVAALYGNIMTNSPIRAFIITSIPKIPTHHIF